MKKILGAFLLALAFLAPVNMGWATLVLLPSAIYYPNIGGYNSSFYTFFTTATLDAAGEYSSYILVAREDMVVSHIAFRSGTVTGATTKAVVSIEGVDASGIPDGTPAYGSAAGTSANLATNTYSVTALGTAATIPKGSVYVVKIAFESTGTFIVQHGGWETPYSTSLPYRVTNVTGSAVKATMSVVTPAVALGSSATTFYQVPGLMPADGAGGSAFSNSVAGAKRGMVFTIPMNARAVGIRWLNGNSTGNYNISLMDSAGNELSGSSTAYDGDVSGSSTALSWNAYFDNPVTLTAGTTYRVAIAPTSATNVQVGTITMSSSIYRGAFPGQNTVSYATFTTAGGWVDTDTAVPIMDVILDQIDDGAGSGAGGGRCIGC